MAKLIQRFSSALAAGRAAADPARLAQPDTAHPFTAKKYILAFILEQSLEDARASAGALLKTAREIGADVVLVTDRTEVPYYQIDACITEFLPSAVRLSEIRSDRAARTYVKQRVGILIRKWEPIKILAIGAASEAIYNFCELTDS